MAETKNCYKLQFFFVCDLFLLFKLMMIVTQFPCSIFLKKKFFCGKIFKVNLIKIHFAEIDMRKTTTATTICVKKYWHFWTFLLLYKHFSSLFFLGWWGGEGVVLYLKCIKLNLFYHDNVERRNKLMMIFIIMVLQWLLIFFSIYFIITRIIIFVFFLLFIIFEICGTFKIGFKGFFFCVNVY